MKCKSRKPNSEELAFMMLVKKLPCIICGNPPINDFDHVTSCGRRLGHSWGIPLCKNCHTGGNGYSSGKCNWDKSAAGQLKLCKKTYETLGLVMPMPYSKIPNYYERMLQE